MNKSVWMAVGVTLAAIVVLNQTDAGRKLLGGNRFFR